MNLLISACLTGIRCRYDGQCRPIFHLDLLNKVFTLIPVCPEVMGGLSTPRPPAEIVGGSVQTKAGKDVTPAYKQGSEIVLQIARSSGTAIALLKERSPACGCGSIHNGCFDGGCVAGDGVCAALLKQNGVAVYGESRIQTLLAMAD